MENNEEKKDDLKEQKQVIDEQKQEDLAKDSLDKKPTELDSIKEFYSKEFDKLKKELAGVNRANSELQKAVKKYETEKMTEEERLSLEKQTLAEEFRKIWTLKAVNKSGWALEDDIRFEDYLYGENEEDVVTKADKLKEWIDNKIKIGIKKGVEEQLALGSYIPKSGMPSDGKKSFTDMDNKELGIAYKEAKTEEEKNEIWNEQLKRQGIG